MSSKRKQTSVRVAASTLRTLSAAARRMNSPTLDHTVETLAKAYLLGAKTGAV